MCIVGSIDQAERHLLSHVSRQGRVRAPCSARAIETALYLYYLEGPSAPHSTLPLREWCLRFLDRSAPSSSGTTADLTDVFSTLLVRGVLGLQDERQANRLHRALADFVHHSSLRKQLLFSVLLAETGSVSFDDLEFSASSFDFPNSQHWSQLMMIGARIIYGNATNDRRFLSPVDLERIEKSQSPNGSWENHILLTLVLLVALKPDNRLPVVADRAAGFVERQLTPDGGVPFVPDVDVWMTALTGFLFTQRGTRPETRTRMADYLAGIQHKSGGWGFSEEVRESDVDDAALCCLFLQMHDREQYTDAVRSAHWYLLESQNPDGGFSTYRKGAPSETEVTAHVVMTLADAQRSTHQLRHAWNWLVEAQLVDGSFPFDWTLSSQYAVSQVLCAFRAMRRRGIYCEESYRRALEFVLDSQNPDGGWGQFRSLPSTGLSTAYALISLGPERKGEFDSAQRSGRSFLERQQRQNGGFWSPPDALGPRPLVYDVELFSTVYAYWALDPQQPGRY